MKKHYVIVSSKRKHKKYDVFIDGHYLLSFGDTRYQQYHDRFGHYSHLDHKDKKRRQNYCTRHRNDHINDPNFAGYWSYHFLW